MSTDLDEMSKHVLGVVFLKTLYTYTLYVHSRVKIFLESISRDTQPLIGSPVKVLLWSSLYYSWEGYIGRGVNAL